jgi:hypothetical protein
MIFLLQYLVFFGDPLDPAPDEMALYFLAPRIRICFLFTVDLALRSCSFFRKKIKSSESQVKFCHNHFKICTTLNDETDYMIHPMEMIETNLLQIHSDFSLVQ